MIPYIGDISKQDAIVLRRLAEVNNDILEFGVGASTQVIAAYSKGRFTSIDTDRDWISRTISNIKLLEIQRMPEFRLYSEFDFTTGSYDFVFDDGENAYGSTMRRDFALAIWPRIKIGGVLALHDTRSYSVKHLLEIIESVFTEISIVSINVDGSNISVMVKREPLVYRNWQTDEGMLPWQYGWGEPDVNYIKAKLKEKNGN